MKVQMNKMYDQLTPSNIAQTRDKYAVYIIEIYLFFQNRKSRIKAHGQNLTQETMHHHL